MSDNDAVMNVYKDFDHYHSPIGHDGTPYQYFESLRDVMVETNTPIGWSEPYGGFWSVMGWDETKEVFHNPEVFSNEIVTFPSYGTPDDTPIMISQYDDPLHKKYRKLVQSAFSPANATKYNNELRETVSGLIDNFIELGHCDIVESLTNEVPARLISIIIGLDPEDGVRYRTWTHAMAQQVHVDPEGAAAHMRDLDDYFAETLEHRRNNLGDDVLSTVIQSEIDGQRLTDQEIKDFWVLLLLGGIDNTTKLLGSMMWRLAWDKELRRRLRDHPELIPTSIDEFLRYYSPGMSARLVTKPIDIGGVSMEPGQAVVLFNPISNRDPRQFPDPDVFIPDRSPNRHFALGLGIHRCLGAHLVRVEATIMLEEALRRMPEWELDPTAKPRWLQGQVAGIEECKIVFPPGGGEPDPDWTPASAVAVG